MPAGRRALATLLALALVPGCATTKTDVSAPVLGRTVSVVTEPVKEKVTGELLVVEKDRLYRRRGSVGLLRRRALVQRINACSGFTLV